MCYVVLVIVILLVVIVVWDSWFEVEKVLKGNLDNMFKVYFVDVMEFLVFMSEYKGV